jgi:hypothetical protein
MFAYFGHHKCGTVWIVSIVKEIAEIAGLRVAHHHNDSGFGGDIVAYGEKFPFDFWCYTNADYCFVRGLAVRGFHVVRDPRDLVVSAYFSHLNSHPEEGWPQLHHFREFIRSLSKEEGLLREMEFIAPVLYNMLVWDRPAPGVCDVRFEELIADPSGLFCEIYARMGLVPHRISETVVRDAVERNSFRRFSGGREPGTEDARHHFRKGIPGDWRNHFTGGHVRYFKMLFNPLLLKLGYERDENWDLRAGDRAGVMSNS